MRRFELKHRELIVQTVYIFPCWSSQSASHRPQGGGAEAGAGAGGGAGAARGPRPGEYSKHRAVITRSSTNRVAAGLHDALVKVADVHIGDGTEVHSETGGNSNYFSCY